jgi:signal transduction histidine kinase
MEWGRRLWRWLLQSPAYGWAGLMLAVLIGSLAYASRPVAVPDARLLREAEVTHLQGGQTIRKRVRLPHVWDDEQPVWEGEASYRLAWPEGLDQKTFGSEQLGLLLPRVGSRFRVYLNGHDIYHQGWDRAGHVDTAAVPHLVRLPTPLLAADPAANVLQIQVKGAPLRRSGLSTLQIGPVHGLLARHELVTWWQVQGTWMVASCGLMLALMALAMWLQTRERMFALLSVASFAWTVRLVLTPVIHSPLPLEWWFYVHKLSFTVYCGFMYLFFWDLFDYRQGAIRNLVKGLLLVAPFWLAYTVYSGDYRLYTVWSGIMLLTAVVALLKMFHRARWGLDADQRFMMVVCLAILSTGVRDYVVVHLGWPGDADIRWMTAGSFALMFSLGWVLVRRTTDAMGQVRLLNAELSRKVGEREDELQRLFEQLRLVESQRVLEAERRRLTRDMHDGLGSQLVQALNVVRGSGEQVDSSAVAAMLNHALEDLRMTLDSLEPMEGDLTTILGTLRQRIAPALQAARVELHWQVQEVPPVPGLEARGVLHVFRCLQEVFANVLKHAQAQRVTVSTRDLGGQVELCVRDDGVGLGQLDRMRAPGGGRGMGNIRLRAAELGVAVSFEDARPGTCVRFLFPLQQPGSLVAG